MKTFEHTSKVEIILLVEYFGFNFQLPDISLLLGFALVFCSLECKKRWNLIRFYICLNLTFAEQPCFKKKKGLWKQSSNGIPRAGL